MTAQVIHGDCLEMLMDIADGTQDLVLADPPYMIGAVSVGNAKSKSGTWADMENSAHWFTAWFREAQRVLRPTGYLAVCTNWRSLPTLMRALSLCKMPSTSCLVWDKAWIGPAGPSQLRPTYEMVLIAAMPDARIDDRGASDIHRVKWMASHSGKSGHPAEKPVELMRHLIKLLSPAEGAVLDPFCGSGTTGIAALLEGRRFIGIEREAEYVDIARARIAAAAPLLLNASDD